MSPSGRSGHALVFVFGDLCAVRSGACVERSGGGGGGGGGIRMKDRSVFGY